MAEGSVSAMSGHGFAIVAGAAFVAIVILYPLLQAIAKMFGVTI